MNEVFSTNKIKKARTLGRCYDLQSLFDRLNRIYFASELELKIQWSLREPKKAKWSVELGSYDSKTKTITISKRLDRPDVPLYFLEYVIFHEMLHHVFPRDNHRMHTEKFKNFERMFPDYDRAREWEKKSMKILFSAPQQSLWKNAAPH